MASALKSPHAVHQIPFGRQWLAAATMINARCVTSFPNVRASRSYLLVSAYDLGLHGTPHKPKAHERRSIL